MTKVNRQEINDIRDTLKRANIKVTLPRIMIFQILKSYPQGMTAYYIENASLLINNRINLSTIYSTLKLFQSSGLIQRYKMNLKQAMYSLNYVEGPIRVSCSQCGSLEIFDDTSIQLHVDHLCQLKKLHLQNYSVVLRVDHCDHCQIKPS